MLGACIVLRACIDSVTRLVLFKFSRSSRATVIIGRILTVVSISS
jgi:hypothetical protein